MPSSQKRGSRGFHLFGLVLIVVAVAAVVIVAIFFRPGAFSVVAEGQGASIKLNFANSRVNLNEVLEKLLEESGSGADAEPKRRLVLSILQAHHLYRVPSVEAVMAMRGIEETETTRDAVRAMRMMLYDLAGPFARPATFLEAPDDRLLLAIDDLYQRNPASPVVTRLWELSLDMKGVFEPRDIRVSIREDRTLPPGVAATCAGNVWLDRVGLIRMEDEGQAISPRIDVAKACGPSAGESQPEKKSQVWLSPSDRSNLIGNETSGAGKEIYAILTPLPKTLVPEASQR
jgi:hypothetical protein